MLSFSILSQSFFSVSPHLSLVSCFVERPLWPDLYVSHVNRKLVKSQYADNIMNLTTMVNMEFPGKWKANVRR